MPKSVVIIGKGPSVSKSTKEFIDSFDEVAICNFPPMESYQHLISNRAHYHFLNVGDPHPYKKEFINNLGLKKIFNTQAHWETGNNIITNPPDKILPNHQIEYCWDFGVKVRKKYEEKYKIWPSTGIMALEYFLNSDEHDCISLVGFDFFSAGKNVYYFSREETNPSLHYLWNGKTYSTDGVVIKAGHDSEETKKVVLSLIQNSSKDITINNFMTIK
jgi:hypothetical protein